MARCCCGYWSRRSPGQKDGGKSCCGLARQTDGRLLRIERKADGLVLVPPGQDAILLFPAGEDHWSARSVNATVTFAYDRGPAAARLVLHQQAVYVEDVEA